MLITDLERVGALALARRDEFEVMMHQLQDDDDLTDEQIDAAVERVAQPIIEAIDCTQCANCCHHLDVQLGLDDLERLAEGLNMPLERMYDYVDLQEGDDPDIIGTFRAKPCALLENNLCTVYEHRPEACRNYPQFTPDFRWTLGWMIDGAHLCPIIYNVMSEMVDVADELQRPQT